MSVRLEAAVTPNKHSTAGGESRARVRTMSRAKLLPGSGTLGNR